MKTLRPALKVIQDVEIKDDWAKTFRNEEFLLYQETGSGNVIFCTDMALNIFL